MTSFNQKQEQLWVDDIPLATIAQNAGTPVYVYSASAFTRNLKEFSSAVQGIDHLIAYSVKANSNLAILTLLAKLGAGADVVSGGELERALQAGIAPHNIVFSGVGKSKEEMQAALSANHGTGICQFNVESEPELIALSEVATAMGKIAPVALRINPDVTAGGHEKISTGKAENKFGIDINLAREVYRNVRDLPGVEVTGVDMHIGSQINSLTPFEMAMDKILELIKALRFDGHQINTYDLGGGLGIHYHDDSDIPPLPSAYGAMVTKKLKGKGLKAIFEPGRAIAGNAGVLLAKVKYIKSGGARNFLILDAAMNDLIRPALYGAHHEINPVNAKSNHEKMTYDIVGPVCETGDTFAVMREMPKMQQGDLVAISSAGAYGAVQSSEYNTRPLIPEVLVSAKQYAVIRKRPTIKDILEREDVPSWV